MELKHLSEEEIQDYLDSSPSSVDQTAEEHLKTCELCKGVVEEYRRVYAELKADKGFELSPDFSASVISRLPKEEVSRSGISYAMILMAGISVLVLFSTAIYLLNWKGLTQVISGIFSPYSGTISVYGELIGRFFANLNINVGLLALSALVLLVISLLDYILFSGRDKLISFFQVMRTS